MRSRELNQQRQRILNLIDQASEFKEDQIELQSHWARYLCVLVAGFMENAIADIYSRYAVAHSDKRVGNYVSASMRRVNNPNHKRFVEIAQAFDRKWGAELNAYFEEGSRKDALNSIMAQRHRVVHGQDSDISLVRVKEYFKKCVEIVTEIEVLCRVDTP